MITLLKIAVGYLVFVLYVGLLCLAAEGSVDRGWWRRLLGLDDEEGRP